MAFVSSLQVFYEMRFCTNFYNIMLYTEDFSMGHYVGFSQIRSHMCVCMCVCLCVSVCVCVCLCVCVCVSPPLRPLITSDVMGHDMNLVWLLKVLCPLCGSYSQYQ